VRLFPPEYGRHGRRPRADLLVGAAGSFVGPADALDTPLGHLCVKGRFGFEFVRRRAGE